jgi:hypothetical protein
MIGLRRKAIKLLSSCGGKVAMHDKASPFLVIFKSPEQETRVARWHIF